MFEKSNAPKMPPHVAEIVKEMLSNVDERSIYKDMIIPVILDAYTAEIPPNEEILPGIKFSEINMIPGFHKHGKLIECMFDFTLTRMVYALLGNLCPPAVCDIIFYSCEDQWYNLAKAQFQFKPELMNTAELDAKFGNACSEQSAKLIDSLLARLPSETTTPNVLH